MKKILISLMLIFAGFNLFGPPTAKATVSSTTSKITYVGDGVTTNYTFPFNIYLSSDLTLQKLNVATGEITTLVLNSDYTVALTHSAPSNGTVTLSVALASGYNLVILRSIPYTQLINIVNNSPTPASVTNEAYDRGVMLSQQLLELVSRSITQNAFSSNDLTFPSAVVGQCIGWAGDSTLTNLDCSGSGGGGGGGSAFNPPIADSQLQTITATNKVNGSALYSFGSIPGGAGTIPVANLPTGTSANKLLQLDSSAKIPAVDGSQVINLSGANFTSLASIPSGAGIIPVANLPTGTTGRQVFTSSGTFVAPTGITKVYLTMVGSGGGGGSGGSGSNRRGGGGGGSGAYASGVPYTVVAGNSYTVTVNNAGTGGSGVSAAAGNTGATGGTVVFDAFTINGGVGGSGGDGSAASGGAGGTVNGAGAASSGATQGQGSGISGFAGLTGGASDNNTYTGGGGGAGGFAGVGGAGSQGTTANNASAGTGYGSGGGGSGGQSGTTGNGGAGAKGIVIVDY